MITYTSGQRTVGVLGSETITGWILRRSCLQHWPMICNLFVLPLCFSMVEHVMVLSFRKWPGNYMVKKCIRFENIPYSYITQSILQETFNWHTCWNVSWPRDLDLQIWPIYPSTWPTCRNSSLYVCPFGRESGNRQTDWQTHRQTMSKLLHPTRHRCGL